MKNLKSEYKSEIRRHPSRFQRVRLWTLISFLAVVVMFPAGLAGQTAVPAMGVPTLGAAYGTGAQTPLQFAGEAAPLNQISLNFGASTFYDDNVLATSSDRRSDEALSFTSQLGVTKSTERLVFNFSYVPAFLLYRQTSQYDRLNHAANLGLSYQMSDRFILGLYDAFSYQNGFLPSFAGQPILAGLTSPTGLNGGIYPYTTRTLSNMAGLDLTFAKSRRTSFTISGSYDQRKFGGQAGATGSLYNDNGASGGLEFKYRITDHTNFGFLLLHQDTTYQGGEVFGNHQRSQVESAYLSVGSRLSPTVSVTVFGGPQHVRNLGQSSGRPGVADGFQGSGGGSITKEVGRTALNLSLQRSVSDGGGVYTSIVDTHADFGVRRQLVGRWEADLSGGATQGEVSLLPSSYGKLDAVTGGIQFIRPLRGNSRLYISYDTIHQLSKGTLPILADFDRNQVTIGIDYQLKAIPLGR
ncbi:MAG: hypothetical protein ACLQVL_31320 [Terriglobia bacterium]